jgi:hypothetical protein
MAQFLGANAASRCSSTAPPFTVLTTIALDAPYDQLNSGDVAAAHAGVSQAHDELIARSVSRLLATADARSSGSPAPEVDSHDAAATLLRRMLLRGRRGSHYGRTAVLSAAAAIPKLVSVRSRWA